MISFKSYNKKILNFKITVENVDPESLSSYFRMNINDVEYGFKGEIQENGKIKFELPRLDNILKEGVSSGKYNAKLEIVGSEFHSVPWNEEIEIKNVPKITVESADDIQEEVISTKQGIKTVMVEEENILPEEVDNEDIVTENADNTPTWMPKFES